MKGLAVDLPDISDDLMWQVRATTRSYTARILKHGPNYAMPGADHIIWEHGRRNMALRAAGVLAIACPISDGGDVAGVGIFKADPAEVERIMAGDPAVQAGVLTFEVHPARGIPGDQLPAADEARRAVT
jgi:hypothetical protein